MTVELPEFGAWGEVLAPLVESAGIFDPDRIDATCEQLAAAASGDEAGAAELKANRRRLVECDGRLAKYRAALECGADPSVVAAWIAEVQAERAAAERSLAQLLPQQPVSATELREIVEELADIPAVLAAADPELRARVYVDLGITLTYRPAADLVTVAAVPSRVRKCVSEGRLNLKVHHCSGGS
jgi:site-specific DNA recombinase